MYDFMLVLTVVIFLVVSAWFLRQPAASLFHPMTYYLLFHGLVFTVRPIFARIYDFHVMYDVIEFQPTEWDRCAALICANLTLLSFGAVCMALANEPIRFGQNAVEEGRREPLLRVFWPIAAGLAMLGVWSILSGLETVSTTDADQWRSVDSKTGATYLTGANGYFINLTLLLPPIVAIIAYLGRFRWWSLLPLAMFALLNLGTGARSQVVIGALMTGLLYMLDRRRRWPSIAILPIAAAGWLIFSAVGSDRGEAIRVAMGIDERSTAVIARSEEKPMETMDLANMEFLEMLIWAVPQRTGTYEYFVHNLQIFTEPIPRALWPGKPVGPPIRMFELYRYAVPLGATTSIAGAGWIAAGYVGVIIWASLFGAIFGWAYRAYVRGSGGIVGSVAYVTFAATSPVIYRDGSVITILKLVQFYYIPVIALALVSYYFVQNAYTARSRKNDSSTSMMTARDRRRMRATGTVDLAETPETTGFVDAGLTTPDLGSPRGRRIARSTLL